MDFHTALQEIAQGVAAASAGAMVQHLYPAVPHHIRELQRAKEAVRRLQRPRLFAGISHELGYWHEVNRAEACIRDAIRAHRFARGTSAIQTFGTVLAPKVAPLREQVAA